MKHVPHLVLEVRLPIPRIREIVLHGTTLLACTSGASSTVGADPTVVAFDVTEPKAPRVLSQITLPQPVRFLTVHGGVLYGTEHYRSIDLLDVRAPSHLAHFDSELTFGRDIEHLSVLGDVLVAKSDDALESWDVRDPRRPVHRPTFTQKKLELGAIAASGDRLYCAAKKAGLLVFAAKDDTFREVARASLKGFCAEEVHVTADRVFLLGEGKKDANLVVLDRATLSLVFQGKSGIGSVRAAHPTEDGSLIVFGPHYQCTLFGKDGTVTPLFEQFETESKKYLERVGRIAREEEDDADEDEADHEGDEDEDSDAGEELEPTSIASEAHLAERDASELDDEESRRARCMENVSSFVRRDGYLITAQDDELIVYSIRPTSPLAGLIPDRVLAGR